MIAGLLRMSASLLARSRPLELCNRTLSLWTPHRIPLCASNTSSSITSRSRFLEPNNISFIQAEGYKVKVKLRKRCLKCYFQKREGRMYVECSAKPRHKQMQKIHKSRVWKED